MEVPETLLIKDKERKRKRKIQANCMEKGLCAARQRRQTFPYNKYILYSRFVLMVFSLLCPVGRPLTRLSSHSNSLILYISRLAKTNPALSSVTTVRTLFLIKTFLSTSSTATISVISCSEYIYNCRKITVRLYCAVIACGT